MPRTKWRSIEYQARMLANKAAFLDSGTYSPEYERTLYVEISALMSALDTRIKALSPNERSLT